MSFRHFQSTTATATTLFCLSFLFVVLTSSCLVGQDECVGYRLVQRTVYDQTPVKLNKWVSETVSEKQKITTYKPVWKTEKRERRRSVLKPIQETSMREETYVVKRPVTETELRTENVTVYRPEVIRSTQLTTANVEVSQLVPTPGSGRYRARWLAPGYYTDPTTGMAVYRRRGFHWVQQPAVYQLQTGTIPVLTAQPVEQVTMVPEIRQIQKLVEVTRMVESVETRKVPVTNTTYESVEEVVPYEVKFVDWVAVTEEIEVPKAQSRMVQVEMIKHTPRTVTMRVPVDIYGNIIGPAEPLVSSLSNLPTLATPASQTPPNIELAPAETETGSQSSVNETSGSDLNSVLDSASEGLTPQTNLLPIWRPLDSSLSQEETDVVESALPRASKPTRSRESGDHNSAADTIPALGARPSANTPDDTGTENE